MKRWNLWYLASGALQLSCVINCFLDWFRYNDTLNSAPFSATILVNLVFFGIPAAACFLIGIYLEKKRKGDSHETGC